MKFLAFACYGMAVFMLRGLPIWEILLIFFLMGLGFRFHYDEDICDHKNCGYRHKQRRVR